MPVIFPAFLNNTHHQIFVAQCNVWQQSSELSIVVIQHLVVSKMSNLASPTSCMRLINLLYNYCSVNGKTSDVP